MQPTGLIPLFIFIITLLGFLKNPSTVTVIPPLLVLLFVVYRHKPSNGQSLRNTANNLRRHAQQLDNLTQGNGSPPFRVFQLSALFGCVTSGMLITGWQLSLLTFPVLMPAASYAGYRLARVAARK